MAPNAANARNNADFLIVVVFMVYSLEIGELVANYPPVWSRAPICGAL
jgi:hypothetical protein